MLIKEKMTQAIDILNETNIDCWITFVRETIEMKDPAMHFVAEHDVVWEAAFIMHRNGQKIAILGQGDHFDFVDGGLYDSVITYVQSIRQPLIEVLDHLQPHKIGVNYSLDNVAADGLTYGMFRRLQKYLTGTVHADKLVSAEPVISRLRGRKTNEEIRRIKAAAHETLELLDLFAESLRNGWTLRDISRFLHKQMENRKLKAAWSYSGNPGVTSGPHLEGGHATPGDTRVEPGHVLRLDFGIKKNGYSADLQRTWYVLRATEEHAPSEVADAFSVVRQGIRQAAKFLQPGVAGWEVDAVAREVVTANGYPEYQHALGHQVGIWAHDGGSVLAPRWERYGDRPYDKVEKDQIYTLEFGIKTSLGYVGLEEMVLVTESGCEFLVAPQEELGLLRLER